jgi:RNA polymerase sigma-70 factor (ECF subfamily)
VPRAVLRNLRVVGGREASPRELASSFDDAELLTAILHGDQDAAAALYDRLRPRIYATTRRLLGPNDPDVEDCTQNTFVEIVRSIDRYRGDCPLEHWASRIAAHVVYKHVRRRRVERRLFDRPGPASLSDRPEPMSTGQRLVFRDLIGRIRSTLERLDADKVYAFMLHDVLGFDLAEIAEITGVSVAAAQKRLFRGRREVHAELANDPDIGAFDTSLEDGA